MSSFEPISEDEISDYDQEEAIIDSEDDYDAEDEYVLSHDSIVRHHHASFSYQGGWSEAPPLAITNEFTFDQPHIPKVDYNAEQAFYSFMSPGIINKCVFS